MGICVTEGMMKDAFELVVPAALSKVDEVSALLARALEEFPASDKAAAASEIESSAETGDIRVVLGVEEDNALNGISVIAMPTGALSPVPQVIAFFCLGGTAARNKLVDKTVEIIKNAGYSSFWALIAGDDGRRLRAFKRAGAVGRVGGLTEFKLA